MGKLIFLDYDGTYAHHGGAPAGNAAAVRAARDAGHRVLLCTGRSKIMVPRDADFDGLVGSAGCYVEVDGQVIADRRFPPDLARTVLAVLDEARALYVLETPDTLWVSSARADDLRGWLAVNSGEVVDFLDELRLSDDLSEVSFAKVTVLASTVPPAKLVATIGRDEVAMLPSSVHEPEAGACEMFLAGMHKAVGMRVAGAHLGVDRSEMIAFGDGMNDVEMLDYAGLAVSIEGADPRVHAVADHRTAGPAGNGIATAFTHLGLLP